MTKYVYTKNGGTLNLRKTPNGTILARIPDGSTVEFVGSSDGWAQVIYQGMGGYVMSSYLVEKAENTNITKEDLKKVYDSLANTLAVIEKILK